MYYGVNYGYVPGSRAGDGEPVDAYVLGVSVPVERYRGVVIGIIHRKNDVEDKLVVAESAGKYSKEQIRALTEFQERYFDSDIQVEGLPTRTAYRRDRHATRIPPGPSGLL